MECLPENMSKVVIIHNLVWKWPQGFRVVVLVVVESFNMTQSPEIERPET